MKQRNSRGYSQHPTYDPETNQLRGDILKTERSRNDDGPQAVTFHGADENIVNFFYPTLTSMIQSIMLEIAEEREAGKVRPFVEGEPIGMIQPRREFNPPIEEKATLYQREQEKIRALRVRNDRAIARVLEGQ